jgi:hypothetical protein
MLLTMVLSLRAVDGWAGGRRDGWVGGRKDGYQEWVDRWAEYL